MEYIHSLNQLRKITMRVTFKIKKKKNVNMQILYMFNFSQTLVG